MHVAWAVGVDVTDDGVENSIAARDAVHRARAVGPR